MFGAAELSPVRMGFAIPCEPNRTGIEFLDMLVLCDIFVVHSMIEIEKPKTLAVNSKSNFLDYSASGLVMQSLFYWFRQGLKLSNMETGNLPIKNP